MNTQEQCSLNPAPRHEPLTSEQMRAYLRDVRADLLSADETRRTDGLRRLYVELAEGGDIWFDRLGHVARVDGEEGFEAGLVELLFCLSFPDDWPGTPAPPPVC